MSDIAIVFLSTSETSLAKTLTYKEHFHPKDYVYEREREKCQEIDVCQKQEFLSDLKQY